MPDMSSGQTENENERKRRRIDSSCAPVDLCVRQSTSERAYERGEDWKRRFRIAAAALLYLPALATIRVRVCLSV